MKRLKQQKAKPTLEQENMEEKFEGNGMMFKCKLFGMMDVPGPRGDDICHDAILALKSQALKNKKETGGHKQRIFLNLSVKGIRVIDEKTQQMIHGHPIHRISYISHDKDDKRTFGYIVSLKEGHKLFAFRTEKAAALLTANLKSLFQVVFQKYKKKREEEQNGGETTADKSPHEPEPEPATEEKENDRYYSVPDKVTLVEATKTEDTLYTEPKTQSSSGVGNLLDWSDVNDQLEVINQGIKRSDTSELLSGFDDLNFDNVADLDDSAVGDAGLSSQHEESNPFANDTFFKTLDQNANLAEERGLKGSASDSNIPQISNPFLVDSSDNSFSATEHSLISKSKSMDFFSSDHSTPYSAQNPAFDLFNTHTFSVAPSSDNTSSNVNDLFSQPVDSGFSSPLQVDTLQPDQSCLEPARDGDKRQDDPFAALSGDIQGIKGALPVSGKNVATFPQQKPKTGISGAPLQVTSGPTVPQRAPGMAPSNPFFPQGQQSQPAASIPPIPPRVDLFNTAMQPGQPAMQRFNSPFINQQNAMATTGAGMQMGAPAFGNLGSRSPFAQSGMPNQFSGHLPPSLPPRVDLNQPIIGNQDPFITPTPITSDPLYAVVNKSTPANASKSLSPDSDPFASLSSNSPLQQGSDSSDLFGGSSVSASQTNTSTPGKDPFADLAGLGF